MPVRTRLRTFTVMIVVCVFMGTLTGLTAALSVRAQAPVRETLPTGVVRETWPGLPFRELAVLQSLKVVHTFITGPGGQDYDFDEPPTFAPKLLWTTDGDQRVITVTSDGYRIEERDRKGRVEREMVVDTPELRVSERDREWFLSGLKLGFSGAPGQAYDPTPQLRRKWPFAEKRPALAGIALDPPGRLWVSANTTDPASTRIDLYDADPRYLGSREGIPLPLAFSPESDALCRITGGEEGEDSCLLLRVQAGH